MTEQQIRDVFKIWQDERAEGFIRNGVILVPDRSKVRVVVLWITYLQGHSVNYNREHDFFQSDEGRLEIRPCNPDLLNYFSGLRYQFISAVGVDPRCFSELRCRLGNVYSNDQPLTWIS